jgi:transposase-like protein
MPPPGAVSAHAVWLYLRFPLSFRDVEAADRRSNAWIG